MSLSLYVLISHESFTYVSPDVFLAYYKSLIINILQDTVLVSFSAPNASQQCGAFLFVRRLGFRTPMCPTLRGGACTLRQCTSTMVIVGTFVYTALRKRASTRIWSEQRTHDRVNHAFYLYTGAAYMGRLQSSCPPWCISLFLFGQLTYLYTDKSKFPVEIQIKVENIFSLFNNLF